MRSFLLVFVLAGLIAACSDNGDQGDSAPSGEPAPETQGESPEARDLEAGGPVDEPVPEKPEEAGNESSGDADADASAQAEQDAAAEKADSSSGEGADDGAQQSQDTARAPEAIYQDACVACHEQGMAGAPKLADAGKWQNRLDERSLDGLVTNSIEGYRAMPAKGACMDCSEKELRATVKWMLNQAEVSF